MQLFKYVVTNVKKSTTVWGMLDVMLIIFYPSVEVFHMSVFCHGRENTDLIS